MRKFEISGHTRPMKFIRLSPPNTSGYSSDHDVIHALKPGNDNDYSVLWNDTIKDLKYEPTKGDKIYIDKSCDIPRAKVRNWAKDLDIKLVTDPSKASYIFVNRESISSKFDRCWHVPMHLGTLRQFITSNTGSDRLYTEDQGVTMLNKFMGMDDEDYVLSEVGYSSTAWIFKSEYQFYDYKTSTRQRKAVTPYMDSYAVLERDFDNMSRYFIPDKHIKAYLGIIENPDKLRSIDSLNVLVNKDMITIDDEMFMQLDGMLSGTDQDKVLAMEIMANSNLKESIFYLMVLLAQHSKAIEDLNEASHVNFKSMLKFCGFKTIKQVWINIDTIIERSMKEGSFTYENLQAVAEKVKSNINPQSKYFSVSSITANDEIKQYFAKKSKEKECESLVETRVDS